MRVIKRGGSEYRRVATCEGCESELEVLADDLLSCNADQREPEAFYAVCPVCSRWVWMTTEAIPPLVKQAARKRSST